MYLIKQVFSVERICVWKGVLERRLLCDEVVTSPTSESKSSSGSVRTRYIERYKARERERYREKRERERRERERREREERERRERDERDEREERGEIRERER